MLILHAALCNDLLIFVVLYFLLAKRVDVLDDLSDCAIFARDHDHESLWLILFLRVLFKDLSHVKLSHILLEDPVWLWQEPDKVLASAL